MCAYTTIHILLGINTAIESDRNQCIRVYKKLPPGLCSLSYVMRLIIPFCCHQYLFEFNLNSCHYRLASLFLSQNIHHTIIFYLLFILFKFSLFHYLQRIMTCFKISVKSVSFLCKLFFWKQKIFFWKHWKTDFYIWNFMISCSIFSKKKKISQKIV